jgi:hypothetical protein
VSLKVSVFSDGVGQQYFLKINWYLSDVDICLCERLKKSKHEIKWQLIIEKWLAFKTK